MRRKLLCGLAAMFVAIRLTAQPVPARDLWDFPLGAVLEPAAIATEAGTGLWNPASAALPAGIRVRLGAAQVSTSSAQGVDAYLMGGAWQRASGVTFGLSVAKASVGGIVRTENDPTPSGDVPYYTLLVSGTVARRVLPHVTAGISARWREGRADGVDRSAIAADMGVVADHLPWHDLRIAASSFLWRPGREIDDHPMLLTAIDARVAGSTERLHMRFGLQHNAVNRGAHETGPFLSVRAGVAEAKAAVIRSRSFSQTLTRTRSGLALHFARYVVGVGREEGASSLGPLYQITLSSTIK